VTVAHTITLAGMLVQRIPNITCVVGALLLLLGGGCSTGPHRKVTYEVAPQGLSLTHVADTSAELKRRLKPHLSWSCACGSSLAFLWYCEDAGVPVFTLDRAYPMVVDGRRRWATIDPTAEVRFDYHHPVRQFLSLKHLREEIRLDAPRHDADASLVRLISIGPEGSRIFKVASTSVMGDRPWAVDQECCLVLISTNGDVKLVAAGTPPDSSGKVGRIDISNSFDYEVTWTERNNRRPFEIKLTEDETYCETGEYAREGSLVFRRSGELTGQYPMKVRMQSAFSVHSDGPQSLDSLADEMIFFFSDWVDSEWVTPAQRRRVRDLWSADLRRLNPAVKPTQVWPAEHAFVAPDAPAFDRVVYDQVRRTR